MTPETKTDLSRENLRRQLDNVREEYIKAGQGERSLGFYWTRKSSNLAKLLVEEFSQSSSIVLDPFMGSGSTGLGVIQAGKNRLFIGCELNELPVRNFEATIRPSEFIDPSELHDAAASLEKIRGLYLFDLEGSRVEILRIIHSKMTGKLAPIAFQIETNGKRVTLSQDEGNDKFDHLKEEYSLRLSSLEERPSAFLDENPRIAIKAGKKVSDYFGPLGFEALSQIREEPFGLAKKLMIAGGLHLCRLTDSKSQSQFPYWHPTDQIHEQSVYVVMKKQLKALENRLSAISLGPEAKIFPDVESWTSQQKLGVKLIHGSCANDLKSIPTGSVSLVLTDPPYFDQVAYSEYLKLWEHFTDFSSNIEDEIVESSRLAAKKTRQDFLNDTLRAFKEIRRVTENGGLALVYFKDSKPKNLHDFIYTLERSGFKFLTQTHVSKPSFTYKQNASSAMTVGGDSIMVFIAGNSVEIEPQSTKSLAELDAIFVEIMRNYLTSNGPTQLTEIMDGQAILEMYPTGYMKRIKSLKHLVDLASQHFKLNTETREWEIP